MAISMPSSLHIAIFRHVLLLFGFIAFLLSFHFVALPNRALNDGANIVEWTESSETHFRLAIEPIAALLRFFTMEKHPELNGDGDAMERANCIERFFYSIPAAMSWFIILGLPIAICLEKFTRYPIPLGVTSIAGLVVLIAFFLLRRDFYHEASIFPGFHLGTGAYLILASYLLTGLGLIIPYRKELNENSARMARKVK